MSVASLKNGALQLSELIISNEKYSNSAGYVASSASFKSSLTDTSISVPTISATEIVLNSQNVGSDYQLGCYNSLLSINTGDITATPQIQLTNGAGNISVILNCPSNNVLQMPTLEASNITLSTTSGTNPQITGDNSVVNQINFSGNINIGSSITCSNNVVGSVCYNTLVFPQYAGGIYGFKSDTPLTVTNGQSGTYTITIPFNPFDGFLLGNCVVTLNWFSEYPLNYSGYGITSLGNGQVELNFTFWNNQENFPIILSGINGMIFYQG